MLSRSRQKTPMTCAWYAYTCHSEKKYKRIWNRRIRMMTRQRLLEPDFDTILLPLSKRDGAKDLEWGRTARKRFDPREHPEWMRK
jgi:hypothetical protein